eukprot:gene1575-1720_t
MRGLGWVGPQAVFSGFVHAACSVLSSSTESSHASHDDTLSGLHWLQSRIKRLLRGKMLGAIIKLFLLLAMCMTITAFYAMPSAARTPMNLQMISHGMGFNKLGLPADQRKALLRGLTTEVIRHGRIRTTLARAKELKRRVDKMITLAKKGTLHHRRQALAYIYDKDLVASLFEQAPERYGERQGGYCRVIHEEGSRRGDNAKMAILELV